MVSSYQEELTGSNTALLQKDYTWAQDNGNVYTGTVTTTLDPGTSHAAQTKTVQTRDMRLTTRLGPI